MKTAEGSTRQLVQFCAAYFAMYLIYGVAAKYFLDIWKMHEVEMLIYTTIGGSVVCLAWIFLRGWWHRPDGSDLSALWYIIPSGICTAVIVPTTTMMYLLPISVMVAMVIMRASLIVIGRIVDALQIRQGLLKKKVYQEENTAVVFALTAAGIQLFFVKPGDFDFVGNPAAMTILGSYLTAYALRIYIMNYYKNTRPKGAPLHNEWFFSVEQLAASSSLILIGVLVANLVGWTGWSRPEVDAVQPQAIAAAPAGAGAETAALEVPEAVTTAAVEDDTAVKKRLTSARKDPVEALHVFREAFTTPSVSYLRSPDFWSRRLWAIVAGASFGVAAFFSVFIFMFKGRTATFANLANRLTSLVAGTAGTVAFAYFFGGRYPKMTDWISLLYILIAVYYLTLAERRRVAELAEAQELAAGSPAPGKPRS